MKVTFYSNFINHHQLPFCKEMVKLTENNFTFVATQPIPEERKELGYYDLNKQYSFVLTTYDSQENMDLARKLSIESDIVICGSAPEEFASARMEKGKLTFRYLERLNKRGTLRAFSPRMIKSVYHKHFKYRNMPMYVLCASAYTAPDLKMYGCYKNKCLKWGYFPEMKSYNIEELLDRKKPLLILWAGRIIDWKHPEMAVRVAERLKKENIPFEMKIIGTGDMKKQIEKLIFDLDLSDQVKMLGALRPEQVREYMEQASVYLFTSDRQEGWGAVLNEAMNSGCAVIANNEIGSVPFLLENRKNGMVYHKGALKELESLSVLLMKDESLRRKIGSAAYETLCTEWNAENAAKKFIKLSENLINNKDIVFFDDGVCSVAPVKVE